MQRSYNYTKYFTQKYKLPQVSYIYYVGYIEHAFLINILASHPVPGYNFKIHIQTTISRVSELNHLLVSTILLIYFKRKNLKKETDFVPNV